MTLCINDSGTWRDASTVCVNDSGTWREIATGCINDSGTWRCFGFVNIAACSLGSFVEGGYLICKTGSVAWIVAQSETEHTGTWNARSQAVNNAESYYACGDWFVPTCGQLKNPGYQCRTHWDSYQNQYYWSSTDYGFYHSAYVTRMNHGGTTWFSKTNSCPIRAFRTVSY